MTSDFLTWVRETPTTNEKETRTRRFHHKSRKSCNICKLRRVKCDEVHPECGPCRARTTPCVYALYPPQETLEKQTIRRTKARNDACAGPTTADLTFESALGAHVFATSIARMTHTSAANGTTPNSLTYILNHFEQSGYVTISSPTGQRIFRNKVPSMLMSHPLLMHSLLAFSAFHLQHLTTEGNKDHLNNIHNNSLTVTAYYHTQRALSLYGKRIQHYRHTRGDYGPNDTDALVATCILLTSLFYYVGHSDHADPQTWSVAASPNENSPLQSTTSSSNRSLRIDWLSNITGLNIILQLSQFQSNLQSSIWLPFLLEASPRPQKPPPTQWPANLQSQADYDPPACPTTTIALPHLTHLLVNHPLSSDYLPILSLLTPLLSINPSNLVNFSRFISLPSCFPATFTTLIHQQDPPALLLLAYWFQLVARIPHWWSQARGKGEVQVLLQFLEWEGTMDRGQLLVEAVQEFRFWRTGGLEDWVS